MDQWSNPISDLEEILRTLGHFYFFQAVLTVACKMLTIKDNQGKGEVVRSGQSKIDGQL